MISHKNYLPFKKIKIPERNNITTGIGARGRCILWPMIYLRNQMATAAKPMPMILCGVTSSLKRRNAPIEVKMVAGTP